MRLYKTTGTRDGNVEKTLWSGSQAHAATDRKTLVSDDGFKRAEVDTEEVDVPTGKAGLIQFLNNLE